jgi:AcrR family transcriptional regulator
MRLRINAMDLSNNSVHKRIIVAAEPLFAEFGYQNCSLLKIAKAAGTSESGVLRFFDAKQDVFLAVIENALVLLHQRIVEALAAMPRSKAADAAEQLITVLKTIFDLYDEEPEKIALIFSEGGLSIRMLKGSEGRTLMTLPGMIKLVDVFTELFASGRRQGLFREVDPVAAREVYFGIIEGVILGWLLSSEAGAGYKSASPKKVLDVVRKMLNGLR